MRFIHRDPTTTRVGRLPLTSLIDVFFMLLIFMLVTSRFTLDESELSSALQSEQARGSAADLRPQVVHVEQGADGEPVFRLGQRAFRSKDSLTEVLRQLPRESGVFVRAEDAVPVSATAAALQACRDAGFENVTYVPAGR